MQEMIHLRETFRYVAEKSGLQIFQLGEFISIFSKHKEWGVNYVLGLGEETPKNLIESFKRNKLPFVWFSSPYSNSLKQFLENQSLKQVGPLTGLSLDLKEHPAQSIASVEDLEIQPVTTKELFQEWCKVHTMTWKKTLKITLLFFRGLNPRFNQDNRCSLIVAKIKDTYVGSALLDVQGSVAGCYWDCVLPEYRGRGIGTAMIHYRVRQAAAKGCTSIVAQCLNSSLPLYLKAGFKKKTDMALFRWDAD